jgi:hypothetical protein
MRKEIIAAAPDTPIPAGSIWIDLAAVSRIRLTSEDASHPIEAALGAPSATGWRAAQPGEQTIWISFHAPQRVRQISLAFTITEARTHEFLISWSADGGVSYREIVRQQFNFSPTTPREEENYFPDLAAVTDLKLVIRPDLSTDRALATLRHLRLR